MIEGETVFEESEVTELRQNQLLGTIKMLYQAYDIEFEIYQISAPQGWDNIIQLISADDDCCLAGVPEVWVMNDGTTKLSIANDIYGKNNNPVESKVALPLNRWTKIRIRQRRKSHQIYLYELSIDGQVFYSFTNTQARDWNNVEIFASKPWEDAALAVIRSFKIKSEPEGNCMRILSYTN